jgi:hypothetical protein
LAVFGSGTRVNKVAPSNFHHDAIIINMRDVVNRVRLVLGCGNPIVSILGVKLDPAIEIRAV